MPRSALKDLGWKRLYKDLDCPKDVDRPRNGDRPTITPWMILPNLNFLPCVEVFKKFAVGR